MHGAIPEVDQFLRMADGPVRAGATCMAIVGAGSLDLDCWQRLFLFSRAETIYGGSDEIQHEIIATRALGLPRS